MRPQDAVQSITRSYRTKRDTPRPDLSIECYEDPAPMWVVHLLSAVSQHTGGEHDGGEGLMRSLCLWCSEGDADARSAQIVGLTQNWIGGRVVMLYSFLSNAVRTHGGRLPRCPYCDKRVWKRGEPTCVSLNCRDLNDDCEAAS